MFTPAKSFLKPTPQISFRILAEGFQPSQNKLSLTFSYCCRLFVTSKKVISFDLSNFQTLFAKHRGWVSPTQLLDTTAVLMESATCLSRSRTQYDSRCCPVMG